MKVLRILLGQYAEILMALPPQLYMWNEVAARVLTETRVLVARCSYVTGLFNVNSSTGKIVCSLSR